MGTVETPEFAVRADDLSITYDLRPGIPNAVDGVSFSIRSGYTLGLVGEAGSGKSTLARVVAGLGRSGERGAPQIVGGGLEVLGRDVRNMSRRRHEALTLHVGYLPQDAGSSLDPQLPVGENVADPIYQRDAEFDRIEAGGLVARLIDAVRLPLAVMSKFPHELSRGQRQRVALAKSLILEPKLLVADDPTMGVDVLVRGRILNVIADLQRELGFSALVIGHDLRELRTMTDQIAVLHRGMLVGYGQVDEVLANPLHRYVEALADIDEHGLKGAALHLRLAEQ